MSEFHALVPAAGSGSRMGDELPKQYLTLAGKPMIYHALATLCACADIATVFVVLSPEDDAFARLRLVALCGQAAAAVLRRRDARRRAC